MNTVGRPGWADPTPSGEGALAALEQGQYVPLDLMFEGEG